LSRPGNRWENSPVPELFRVYQGFEAEQGKGQTAKVKPASAGIRSATARAMFAYALALQPKNSGVAIRFPGTAI